MLWKTAVALLCAATSPLAAQTLLPYAVKPVGKDTVLVAAFATGNLRGVATGSDTASGAANGALGVRLAKHGFAVAATINVAASETIVTGGFAQNILNPASGAGLRSGLLDLRVPGILWRGREGEAGLHVYVSASAATWRNPNDTAQQSAASVLGAGAMLYWQAAAMKDSNTVAIGFEAGLSYRKLSGDIADDEPLRRALLGTGTRNFGGFEVGASVVINKLTAAIQGHWLLPAHVPGVSHFQVTTGLSLQSDLFSFVQARDAENK